MKTAAFLIVNLVLAAACTNIAAPPTASVSPTVGVSPSASPSPSPAPTASPTTALTAAPTASPSPTLAPTIPPSPSGSAVPPTGAPTPTPITVPPPGSDLERLMSHIPESFRQNCHQVTSFDGGFVVGVQCLPDVVDGYVTYYLFDTVENLDASYQGNVDFFGEEATGATCQTEASEGEYTIGATPAGRVMCAPYDPGNPDGSLGLIMFWTHDEYLIESSIVQYSDSYADLYAAWQIAGPNPPEAAALPTIGPTQAPTWSTTATAFRGRIGDRINVACPPGGSAGSVWGTDTYTDDSSVCTAAVHAGLITLAAGGTVTIEMRPGESSYESSTRNGISSSSWGTWSSSFVFVTL